MLPYNARLVFKENLTSSAGICFDGRRRIDEQDGQQKKSIGESG